MASYWRFLSETVNLICPKRLTPERCKQRYVRCRHGGRWLVCRVGLVATAAAVSDCPRVLTSVPLKAVIHNILTLPPISTSWDRAARLFALAGRRRAQRAKNHTVKEMSAFSSLDSPRPRPLSPPWPFYHPGGASL